MSLVGFKDCSMSLDFLYIQVNHEYPGRLVLFPQILGYKVFLNACLDGEGACQFLLILCVKTLCVKASLCKVSVFKRVCV